MNVRDDGGLAFPHHEVWDDDKTDIGWIGGGMTLRDWFAGQALSAIVTTANERELLEGGVLGGRVIAGSCWALADAMIAQRSKP